MNESLAPVSAPGGPADTGLAVALVDLSHHVLHLFAEAGRSHKLSQQQVELVCALVIRGSVGMTELGRLLHLEKSNLSNLVDRLEQRGLVVRRRDPGDRRATQVGLTESGSAIAMDTYEVVTTRVRGLLTSVTAGDQQHLASVIAAIRPGQPGGAVN